MLQTPLHLPLHLIQLKKGPGRPKKPYEQTKKGQVELLKRTKRNRRISNESNTKNKNNPLNMHCFTGTKKMN
jgi:hypothetical protein